MARANISASLDCKPDSVVSEKLNRYREYGITPYEFELRAMLASRAKSLSDYRLIQAVAEKAGFKIDLPDLQEVMKILSSAEKHARTPVMYCPSEFLAEGKELLPDVPVRRDDGSVAYTNGRPSATQLLTYENGLAFFQEKTLENVLEQCEALNRKTFDIVDKGDTEAIEAAQKVARDYEKQLAETTHIESNRNIELAIEAANAESERQAIETLKHYIKG